MKATCLFLGTGASTGIPVIGCSCPVCSSKSSRNHRLRPSVLLKINNQTLLIDCGPDFREQALLYKIDHLDGLLLTHTHYDHIAGIDELRVYYFQNKKPIPCMLSKESYSVVQKRYDYLFEPIEENATKRAQFDFLVLDNDIGIATINGVKLSYFHFLQCNMKVTGYRLGNFAYITDIREYNDEMLDVLQGVENLVISAISLSQSFAHFSVEEAIIFAQKVRAKKTTLTHIAHHLDHETTERMLPPGIYMGYDGLEIEFRI